MCIYIFFTEPHYVYTNQGTCVLRCNVCCERFVRIRVFVCLFRKFQIISYTQISNNNIALVYVCMLGNVKITNHFLDIAYIQFHNKSVPLSVSFHAETSCHILKRVQVKTTYKHYIVDVIYTIANRTKH